MVIVVKSPYADDETRTKLVAKIIEEFIQGNWDAVRTTVGVDDVAWGKFGNQMLESGKEITLRAYSIFENVKRLDLHGNRREYLETLVIDIYILNNEIDTQRDPRAIAIMKWLDELFIRFEGVSFRGIYEMEYRGARVESDPVRDNMTRVKATVDVRYIIDKVDI